MFARAAAHMYGSLLACACHLYLMTRRRVGRRLCLTKQRPAAVHYGRERRGEDLAFAIAMP